jgi:hypothetical protein
VSGLREETNHDAWIDATSQLPAEYGELYS